MRQYLVAAIVAVLPSLAAAADPVPAGAPLPAEKPVCRREPAPVGTRFSGPRICHTPTEWAALDKAAGRNSTEFMRKFDMPQNGINQSR